MSTSVTKLQVDTPADPRQGIRDRSNERSPTVSESVEPLPASLPANDATDQGTKEAVQLQVVPSPGPLVLSVETTERLRQMLRTESLTSEAQLLELTKHALAMQYLRGQNNADGNDPARLPSRLRSKPGRMDSWEQHRRAQRKAKIRNVLATVVILVLAATGTIAVSMFRPALSGDTSRASTTLR